MLSNELIVGDTMLKKLFFIVLSINSLLLAEEPNVAMFQPLPTSAENPANPSNPSKIELGKKLFFETKLSTANDLSCNSCHQLDQYGVDGKQFSSGHLKQLGDRNSPTVYNAALEFTQFWDGRAKDVEEQALGPMMNPKEMAMASKEEVQARLVADPAYVKLFTEAFPGEKQAVNFKNIGKAIGAFERTLLLPSRFDEYLKGKKDALSDSEKKGLTTFVNVGCIACHNGATVGGQMFQKLGLVIPYVAVSKTDLGRANVTGLKSDELVFKVPSLRNVEKTAPYFHDGHVKTMEAAVLIMARHQLGKDLSKQEVADIVVFLRSLTGKIN